MNKFLRILLKLGVTFLILAATVGPIVGIFAKQIQMLMAAGGGMTMPAESVAVAPAAKQAWFSEIRSVGTIVAENGIEITPEASGIVEEILFKSGSVVEAGDLLVKLNADTQTAQLKAAKASAELALLDVERARELYGKEAIAKSELDAAEARSREADAQVENLQALLEKTEVYAPFSGRLGVRMINKGQYINIGQPIVSLQSVDPVFVDSYFPQSKLNLLAEGNDVIARTNIIEGNEREGKVTALNSTIDESTRNILVRSTFENKDGALRPGMFVDVFVRQPEPREVIAIPSTAIVYATYGNSVFVVTEGEDGGKIATQTNVRLGETRGDFIEITHGLEIGQEVVISGAFKLRNGSPVAPTEDAGLKFSETPSPRDA